MTQPAFEVSREGTTVSVCPMEAVVTSEQMRQLLDDVAPYLVEGGASDVIFDMSRVEYLDSACVAKLFTLLKTVQQAEGHIALAHCQPNVAFLLEMTRLDDLFRMFDSIDEAKRTLGEVA